VSGGIDWFRWHHGSVNDPKFQLVARRAGASVAEVIAVWATLLESASMCDTRGYAGEQDFEAIDCALGLSDGRAQAIYDAMQIRGLLDGHGHVARWEKRQPKRERADEASSTDRVRAFRERKRDETPRNANGDEATPSAANDGSETPRGEERREEPVSKPTASHPARRGVRFDEFWAAWPKNERKQDKGKCLDHWKRNELDAVADAILADVRTKRGTQKWAEGYVEAPLVYLRGKRWEDGVTPNEGDGGVSEWFDSVAGIQRKGGELGLGAWDQDAFEHGCGEPWPTYRARVFKAAGHSPRAAA